MLKTISRRAFLSLSAFSFFSAIMGKFSFAGAAPAAEDIFYPRQIITTAPATSRVIMWQSRNYHNSCEIVLKNSSGEEKTQKANCHTLEDDGEKIFIYQVRLENLQPSLQYTYQILQDGVKTAWYPLNTTGLNSIKAIIFPDSQCSDGYVTWHNVAASAFEANPDTRLFINMGDLVDNGEAAYQWRQWFDAISDYMPGRTFIPVMGNHETYDLNWKCRLPKAYLGYFTVPENGSSKFNGYYYSFDCGPVHFCVLNTQFEEIDPIQSGLIPEQLQWLENDIKGTAQPWKVILMHKDIINYDSLDSNEPLADIDIVGRTFMPYFDQLNIDLVFTAHQHTYRRHGHIFNFSPSDHGPVYIDTGVAGNCRYNVPRTKRFDKIMLPQPETDNYLTFEATMSTLTVKCFLPDGKLMDSFVATNNKQ